MEQNTVVLTRADFDRLMGDLSLLFDAVKEMSGVIMSYDSTGFISEENYRKAIDYAVQCTDLEKYWLRATMTQHCRLPDYRRDAT